MKTWQHLGLGVLASLAMALAHRSPGARGQMPVDAVCSPAPAKNLFGFLRLTPEHECTCMPKPCTLAEAMAKPKVEATLVTLGGTAAQIKKSEAEAEARCQAIRYLGTVDCNYWPEAKSSLLSALRGDPNETVRYEAALSLLRGCCRNRESMAALKHATSGSEGDGFPIENSARVRDAAGKALAHYISVSHQMPAPVLEKEPTMLPPVSSRGKGLMGIFTSMTNPRRKTDCGCTSDPLTSGPSTSFASVPCQEHVPAGASAPKEVITITYPEKRTLLQRLGWNSNPTSTTEVIKEPKAQEIIIFTPGAPPVSVVPVGYYPVPQAPYQNLVITSFGKDVPTQGKDLAPVERSTPKPTEALWRPLPQTPVQKTTIETFPLVLPPLPATTAPTVTEPTRPAESAIVPTRGIVILDSNGVR